MNGNSSDQTVQLAKFVKFREESFGGVLFETRSEKVFTLNPTGAAVVREIQAGGSREEIYTRLNQHFSDENDCIGLDVAHFVEELRTRGLVVG